MSRRALWACLAFSLASCLEVPGFFFAGRPIDAYRWDEVDPALDGDLSDAHASLIPASAREERFVLTASGARIHVVYARHAGAPTILYAHGNGEHLGRFWDRVERLHALGFSVVIYDYPGFGMSEGEASERGLYEAADAVASDLAADGETDLTRVFLYGYSLGAGPTTHLARALSAPGSAFRPRGIVLEAAWCSIESLTQDAAGLDLPAEYLPGELRIDNCERARAVRGVPVLALHGDDDGVVPLAEGRRLARSFPEGAEFVVVEGARHADLPLVWGAEYDARIVAFVGE